METKFNFKSQIATDKNQSERLLALGLKKETADMVYTYKREEHEDNYYWELEVLESPWDSFIWSPNGTFIPAWSLYRLLCLIPKEMEANVIPMYGRNYTIPVELEITFELDFRYKKLSNEEFKGFYGVDIYDSAIKCIEWLIKEGYFNKEYLV